MLRFYLRLLLIPLLIFTAALLLIRAQPYDDHELRQLLLPDGCPAPCFMGIRPGVTTADEVLEILKASGWVDQYVYRLGSTTINIRWNDSSPSWLAHKYYGSNIIRLQKDKVVQFSLEITAMLGEIQLSLGQSPFYRTYINTMEGGTFLIYSAIYPNEGITINAFRNCNDHSGQLTYQEKVIVMYEQIKVEDVPQVYYHTGSDAVRTSCR